MISIKRQIDDEQVEIIVTNPSDLPEELQEERKNHFSIRVHSESGKIWCVFPYSRVITSLLYNSFNLFLSKDPLIYYERNSSNIVLTTKGDLRKLDFKSFAMDFASQIELREPIPYRLIVDTDHPDRTGRVIIMFYDEKMELISLMLPNESWRRLPSLVAGILLTKEQVQSRMKYKI